MKYSIKSLVTGEIINTDDQEISVTGAVLVTVPKVMEMRLYPANVNTEQVETGIKEQREIVATTLKKYGVDSLEALEERAEAVLEAKKALTQCNDKLAMVLGTTTTFEVLEKAVTEIPSDTRGLDDIEEDIVNLCGDNGIGSFIATQKANIDNYVREYGSIDGVKVKAFDCQKELGKAQQAVQEVEKIPDAYHDIADPEAYLHHLKGEWDAARQAKEKALSEKSAAEKALETYQDKTAGDPAVEVEESERIFEETKTLLNHWRHIAQVIDKEKGNITDNPMQDIAESFTNYLGLISGGKVSSEFVEADKLDISIYSNDRLLDYGKLSEGTKETISLAFRMAILDHLFPDGDGVIVLDDPFTDMDKERAAQSCRLIKECAKRHQVIFLTCREDYLKALDGNVIRM